MHGSARIYGQIETLVSALTESARPTDRILIMSNGDFGGIYGKILSALKA